MENHRKSVLLASTAALTLALSGPAFAQVQAESAGATSAATDGVLAEDIIVTGSRIRNGFQTPTPVTVTSADDLKAAAPGNIADGLNQLPAFTGSVKTYQATGGGLGSGTVGQNILNLRGLGGNRALVLLDGRRMVATNETGSVDVNVLPQNLIKRVEVVTGGASSAYGSDAVAGVVNFVLDTGFKGLKVETLGGLSTHNDSASVNLSAAFGHQMLDGSLRVIGSVEYQRQEGVGILDKPTGRKWYDTPQGQIPNPNGTVPTVLVVPDLRAALGSYGGLISSGPLRGTQFLTGGVSAPFQYGLATATGTYMSGGDPLAGDPGQSLSPDQRRLNAFLHAEYDLTPDITVFGEYLFSRAHIRNEGSLNFGTGTAGQLTIFRDNAYLPADILARMVTANVQSIPLGRYYREFGPVENESLVRLNRWVGGVKGSLFGWSWDASVQHSRAYQKLAKNNEPILRNLFAASDAVRNASGQIVCRSTLTGFDPGCVPLNPFGNGSISEAAAAYVLGDSVKELVLKQTVAAANVSGDFGDDLQLGAGPISLAAGVEYRKEQASQTSDAISQQVISLTGLRTGVAPTSINNRLGAFQFYNPQPYRGSYDIKEGYAELGVPLLRDFALARLLEFNAAVRYADYSQSGGVTTWKLGANWQVVDDVRLRYTRSRDIRGPNAVELFNTQTQQNQTVLYKGRTVQDLALTSGNAALAPERATTETYGIVYRPGWLPGFQISLDRYDIEIKDAIGSLTAQQTADQCTAGNQAACAQITELTNGTLVIRLQPLNLSVEKNVGYDLEAAYDTELAGGRLTLRGLANHTTAAYRIVPGAARVQSLGLPTQPRWRGSLSAQFATDSWGLFVQETIIGKAKIDPTKVEGVDTNSNSLPVVAYTNLTAKYRFDKLGAKGLEAFFTVTNLFDKEPPFSGGNPSSYNAPVSTAYDTMGRYFSAGFRFAL